MKCHWFYGLYANLDYAGARHLSREHGPTMTNDCQSKKEVVYVWFSAIYNQHIIVSDIMQDSLATTIIVMGYTLIIFRVKEHYFTGNSSVQIIDLFKHIFISLRDQSGTRQIFVIIRKLWCSNVET